MNLAIASPGREGINFSAEGLAELCSMHDKVIANISPAGNVLISGDVGIARQLLEEKNELTLRQRKSRKSHMKRLTRGGTEVLESSDLHLADWTGFKGIQKSYCLNRLPDLIA